MDHSLVVAKLNEDMSHAMQGHPRWTGHSEEFWQNVVRWRGKWEPIPIFLLGEPHEQYEKANRYDTGRWTPPGQKRSYMLLEKSGWWLLRAPERMKALGQNRNDAVMDVPGGESKDRGCKEQCCIGTWNIKFMNQGKLDMVKQEMARVNINIRNQWTKMDRIWANSIQMTIISTTVGKNPLEEIE